MITPAAPAAVTGLGCITAAGRCVAENLATLETGRRAPLPPTLFTPEQMYPVFASGLPDVAETADAAAPAQYEFLRARSRTVRLAAQAALEALADAGFAAARPESLAGRVVGVCLGTSVGTALDMYDFYQARRAGTTAALDEVHTYLRSNPALALARMLGLRGPVLTVTNACSSGADAIGIAAQWIRSGQCDMALCGGADALNCITYQGFASLRLLSPEPCRPFDKNRKGLNLGEGAGMMVLESAASLANPANPASRQPLGHVRGYGTCTDAHHLTAPHPEALGLSKALEQALRQAGAGPEDVALVNAHGTATPTNDAAEALFLRTHFPGTPCLSTKGCTGHTLGAAGAVEAVFALSHLRQGRVPACPGFAEPDPDIGFVPVTAPTPLRGTLALSQSLAFGGNNSILLFSKGDRPCP